MRIKPLNKRVEGQLVRFNLFKRFEKQKSIFEINPAHPGLNVEKLEPKHVGLYSLRISKKYPAIFRIRDGEAEVIHITKHYQK